MTAPPAVGVGVRWTARSGSWLGVGAGPAALVLGAGIAARHDGPAPLVAVVVGGLLMTVLLAAQGVLGLVAPAGEGQTLSGVAPRYLPRAGHRALNGLLAVAMVGWFGFNVGLGGAALGALLGLPAAVGPVLIGVPALALSFGGMQSWNGLAVVATVAAVVLVGLVTGQLADTGSPVTAALGPPGLALADLAGFVGYVAVFSVRAPDFSVGLRSRSDLAACVALLVGPTVVIALAGVALQRGTGSDDLVATLAGSGLPVGNLLVALAVVGPTFTTMYSGSLALRAVTRLPERAAMVAVAVPGLVLAALRFDRLLLGWLALLAAVLPPLVVPMAVEAAARRRGAGHRLVPWWTWLPAGVVALALTAAGVAVAPLVGLALAVAATVAWRVRRGSASGGPYD